MLRLHRKIKGYFQKRYLFEAIKKLEAFSTENKLWRVNCSITALHVDLLIRNKELLDDFDFIKKLSSIRFTSKFNNLSEVEQYVSDFINQSTLFVQGEVRNRPKINNGKLEKDPLRNVGLLYFLEASDGKGILASLVRIKNICVEVGTHCSSAAPARQQILENICKDIFSPLLAILQEIFEVLYANQTRNSSR